jgi:hypothetical protein
MNPEVINNLEKKIKEYEEENSIWQETLKKLIKTISILSFIPFSKYSEIWRALSTK